MKRLSLCLGLALLLAGEPALAAKIITVDPDSGQTSVIEKGGEEGAEPEAEKEKASCPEDREKIERLTRVVRRQQEVILKQQAYIDSLREELQHKENIIQGLDMLRRQGR